MVYVGARVGASVGDATGSVVGSGVGDAETAVNVTVTVSPCATAYAVAQLSTVTVFEVESTAVTVTMPEKASLETVCPALTSEISDTIKLLALVNVTLAESRLDVVAALSVTVEPITETTVVPSANPLVDVTTAPVTIEEVDAEIVSRVSPCEAVIAEATTVSVTITAVTVISVSA